MHSGNSLKPSQNLTDCENIQTAFENIKRPATETFQGVVELAANGEVAANLVVQSNDTRLSNDRNPILHANYHENGGIDPIKLDDLNPPDDNTDLDATILAHGLCPRLSGNNTHALRGDGTWAAPVGMGDMLANLNLSDVANPTTSFNNIKQDATTTYKGVVELATDGEVAANVVVQGNDTRLNNARTPVSHHTTHESGGADAIKLDDLAAPDNNTDLNASTTAHGLMPKLDGSIQSVMQGTGAWVSPSSMGYLRHTNNLSDVSSAATSFGNIKQAATTTATGVVELATDGETGANVVVQGNDSRLSNARIPLAHGTNHESGGTDAIKLDNLAAPDDNTDLNASTTAHGLMPKLDGSIQSVMQGTGAWVSPSSMGYLRHTNNLSDVSSAATSFGNIKQAATTTATGVVELATDGEVGANLVVQANDSRLSDTRTPVSHHTSHESGGGDAIKLDDLAAPDNNTDLDATSSAHGLLPKLSGSATDFLNGNGGWSSPAGGSGWMYPMDFRLTLESGVPVSTTDQTAKTTLYLTPYIGNNIGLYYNSAWVLKSIAEISIAVPASTNTNYDVWAYWDNGTTSVKLELLAWSTDTARATALTRQDGVLVKSGSVTRRYIGTIRTTGTSGQCEVDFGGSASGGDPGSWLVWNYYNRLPIAFLVRDTTSHWTYTSTTVRSLNNSTNNRVSFVYGAQEDNVLAQCAYSCYHSAGNERSYVAVGLNSTSTVSGLAIPSQPTNSSMILGAPGIYNGKTSLGFNYIQALERGPLSGTTTFEGSDAGSIGGLQVEIKA